MTGVKAVRTLLLGLSLSVLATCTSEDKLGDEWGGEILQAPDGWVVRNPGDPIELLSVQHLWSRSSPDWGEPSSVGAFGENLLILDPMVAKVYVLKAEDGSHSFSFGREGEGPGELGRLYGAAIHRNAVYVSHSRTLDLSVYSLEGEFQGSIPWGTPVSQLASWGEEGLAGIPLTQSGWVVAKDLLSEEDAAFVDPHFQSPSPEEEYGSCIRVTAKDGWMVRAMCSALRVRVEGPAVEVPFWIEHPSAPTEAAEDELDEYIARFWEMESGGRSLTPIVQRQLAGVRESARIRPTFSKVRIDLESDRIIVLEQPYGDHGWLPGIFHVFLLNGIYYGRAEPNLHVVDFDPVGDTTYVLARDPDTHELRVEALELRGSEDLEAKAKNVPGPGSTYAGQQG